MSNDLEWTDDVIKQLCSLWDEGLATAEIGRRMGVSKNAIVGKAHRLQLPARPSPIKKLPGNAPAAKRPQRIKKAATLPSLAEAPPISVVDPVPLAPAEPPVAAPRARLKPPMRDHQHRQCCWPIGEPGTPGFRFCDAPAHGRGPYCIEHSEIAHVRRPDRSDALMSTRE